MDCRRKRRSVRRHYKSPLKDDLDHSGDNGDEEKMMNTFGKHNRK